MLRIRACVAVATGWFPWTSGKTAEGGPHWSWLCLRVGTPALLGRSPQGRGVRASGLILLGAWAWQTACGSHVPKLGACFSGCCVGLGQGPGSGPGGAPCPCPAAGPQKSPPSCDPVPRGLACGQFCLVLPTSWHGQGACPGFSLTQVRDLRFACPARP